MTDLTQRPVAAGITYCAFNRLELFLYVLDYYVYTPNLMHLTISLIFISCITVAFLLSYLDINFGTML